MKIDLEHLHYWMCAVRESNNPMRTLDAFWSGQLKSKEWLITELEKIFWVDDVTIDIHGGWVGVLSSLLFQSNIKIKHIKSVDIDPLCNHVATLMNKKEEIEGRFTAITNNMCFEKSKADIIINTSCEHITQEQFDSWLSNQPKSSLLVLQSNNYDIPEHVRTATDINEFIDQSKIKVIWSSTLELPKYNRFMIIGRQELS